MPITIITLKMTEGEIDLLDWIVQQRGYGNRSEALRQCMIQQASMSGANYPAVLDARKERSNHPPRKRRRRGKPKPLVQVLGRVLAESVADILPLEGEKEVKGKRGVKRK